MDGFQFVLLILTAVGKVSLWTLGTTARLLKAIVAGTVDTTAAGIEGSIPVLNSAGGLVVTVIEGMKASITTIAGILWWLITLPFTLLGLAWTASGVICVILFEVLGALAALGLLK
jgi:hypothetical protein